MTRSAREFLDRWVSEHIASLTHDMDDTEARGSARMCVADAEQHGIPTPLLRTLRQVTLWPLWQARSGRRFERKRNDPPTTAADLS
jgi:hypothetical protein